ncbi:threonine-phosphate decarboxylase CobD [Desulfolucanica intricata]|uniref:threonine-phosphate decarboxylase CobD n=1 Tax=Desulfolucanica intricata TaxID=1285191 RepID=UPI000832F3B0|nr:threonine-phosphate decarboxylase CobD [Desulfolucanica intricata]
MKALQHIHGGNLTVARKKFGFEEKEFIDFSANINPLGPSSKAMALIVENLSMITSYPDPDCQELSFTLSNYLHISSDNLLFGNGATELIYLLVDIFKYKKALVTAPTFSEYGLAVLSRGGEVEEIPLSENNCFSLPVEEIIKRLPGREVLFLCNPNNPTGALTSKKDIICIIDAAREHDCMVVIDEAFMDFVINKEDYSVINETEKRTNLIVLYSLTKYFGIPGLRLGAMVAEKAIIQRIKAGKDPWSVNTLAQIAGVESLRDHEYIRDTQKLIVEERQFLYESLGKIPGIKVYPGAANYLLVNVSKTGYPSHAFVKHLGARGILVRDCVSFTGMGDSYLRLAVKKRSDNEKLIDALEDFLGGKVK